MGLKEKLEALRPELATAAQRVLDEWAQDEEGIDEEFGAGGACDSICTALSDVLGQEIDGIEITDGGHPGDDHAFLIVYDDKEAFAVDIPPGVYETGGGYSWKKIKGAEIGPEDVLVNEVERDLVAEW